MMSRPRTMSVKATSLVGAALTVTAAILPGDLAAQSNPADGPPRLEAPPATGSVEGEGPRAAPPHLYLGLDSRLWIDGSSTLRDFTCEAGVIAADMRPNPVEDPFALETLDRAISEISVQIPAGELDCSNGTMNDHMWEALQVEEHPDIRFEVSEYQVVAREGDAATLQLSGELTMAGASRAHTLTAEARRTARDSLRVVGSTRLDMTDFEVDPPRFMFGLMKVHDPVTIRFDLVVVAQIAPGASTR